ncbi:hypothetical protein KQI84_05305 [bacterium]|nr:hypothetical protein [bacterium]
MHSSPVADDHRSRGAEFRSMFGWEIPAHFGDPGAEYEAARNTAAVVDLSFLTIVRVEGSDRADYLNRRLSQLILGMQDGDGQRAALLDAVGKMQADLEVFADGEEFLLLAAPFEGDQLAPRLDQYVFSEDCRFHDETRGHAKFALVGPQFADLIGALDVRPLDAGAQCAERTVAGQFGLHLVRSDLVPEGLLLIAPAATAGNVWDELVRAAQRIGGRAAGWDAFNTRRIEADTPWFGIDLDHDTIPLEAALSSAISFNKGCYPGQETIAKISNLGHPAKQLVSVQVHGESLPDLPAELRTSAGEFAGTLTSAAVSPARKHTIGFATVKWAFRDEGVELLTSSEHRVVIQKAVGE